MPTGLLLAALASAPGSWAQDGGPDAGPIDAATPSLDAGLPDADGPDAAVSGPDASIPDPVWTCEPSYYNAADGCDCECGIPDPDCDLPNQVVYGCPADIACSDQGYCELPGCGDGVVESPLETCDDGNTVPYDGCSPGCKPEAGYSCTADPTTCIPVPAGWSSAIGPFCVDGRYGDGMFCDCGCGVLDADCEDPAALCDGLPLGCIPEAAVDQDGEILWDTLTFVPDTTDNTACVANTCGDGYAVGAEECDDGNTTAGDLCDAQCVIETPPGWTCNPEYVLDPECDCGCGAPDPACPGLALDPATDCAFDECRGPAHVDPTDHSQCLPDVPAAPDAGTLDSGMAPPPDAGVGADAGDANEEPMDCGAVHVPRASWPLSGCLAWAGCLWLSRRRKTALTGKRD